MSAKSAKERAKLNATIACKRPLVREVIRDLRVRCFDDPETAVVIGAGKKRTSNFVTVRSAVVDQSRGAWRADARGHDPVATLLKAFVERVNRYGLVTGGRT